jgi:hypothetical protein
MTNIKIATRRIRQAATAITAGVMTERFVWREAATEVVF